MKREQNSSCSFNTNTNLQKEKSSENTFLLILFSSLFLVEMEGWADLIIVVKR